MGFEAFNVVKIQTVFFWIMKLCVLMMLNNILQEPGASIFTSTVVDGSSRLLQNISNHSPDYTVP